MAEAEARSEPYTFDYIALDLKEVLDELGVDKCHVIGESFGGVVSQVFSLNYPERVDRLVLISTAPAFDLSLKNRVLLPIFPLIPQAVFARLHVSDVCEPDDPDWAKELFIRNAAWADHASVVARANIVSRVDLTDRVPSISAPTMLVVGNRDRFTGEASAKMLELLPDARMVELEGGHLAHMLHPARFAAEVAGFLAESR